MSDILAQNLKKQVFPTFLIIKTTVCLYLYFKFYSIEGHFTSGVILGDICVIAVSKFFSKKSKLQPPMCFDEKEQTDELFITTDESIVHRAIKLSNISDEVS